MDGTGHRVVYRFEEDEMLHIRAWTPDGRKVIGAFEKKSQPLQLVAFSVEDGSMQVLHTFDTYWPMWQSPLHKVAVSPDGRYIAYDRPPKKGSWDSEIYVLDIERQSATCVLKNPAYDKLLDWTPDGRHIFFKSDRRQGVPGGFTATDTWDAYLLPVANGKPQGAPVLIKRDIPDNLRPKGFTRDGAYYYAVEFRTIEVAVATLDLQAGKLLGRPQVAGQTGADQIPAWSPDGKHLAYCTHELNNSQTIRIQNIATGQERKLDPNLPHFTWLRWSPDGKSFLVSNFAKNSPRAICRINAETGERLTMVQSESSETLPGEPQLSPDGGTLFYILHHSDSKKVSLLTRDIESGNEEELLALEGIRDIGSLTFALSPDGRQLALVSQVKASSGEGVDRRISVMSAKGGKPRELCRPDGLRTRQTIAWTPDGQALLFTKRVPEGGRELWHVSIGDGVARKICGPREMMCQEMMYGAASMLDIHPDGQRIAYDCFEYRHEVWVMENFLPGAPVAIPEPESRPTLRQIEVRGRGRVHSRPSFDGKYMLDVDREMGNLIIRELATSKEWKLPVISDPNAFVYESRMSPDSKRVAFLQFNPVEEDFDLCIIDFDGSGQRTLMDSCQIAGYFNMDAWSPDGKYIFGRLERKPMELARVSADDGSVQIIKKFEQGKLSMVQVSPDGRYLAYSRAEQTDSKPDIFIFDLEQNQETPLVVHPAADKLLGWTPDGQNVFFTSDRNGTWDGWLLRVVDGKGRGLPEVIKAGIGDISPIGFTRSGSFYCGFQHQAWNVYTAALDRNTGQVVSEPIPVRHVGKDAWADWSPDGRYLAYLSEPDRTKPQVIRIRTLTTGQERELKIDLPRFEWLRWCPDSRHLLITSFSWNSPSMVYKVDVETGKYTPVVKSEQRSVRQAELSADGKTLVYRIRGSGNATWLIARNMETGTEKELLQIGDVMGATSLALWSLSPNGEQVALSMRQDKVDQPRILKVITVETGESRTLVGDMGLFLLWSSDGRDLLFTKEGNELWRVDAEGGEPRRIWEWKEKIWSPRIHPDGQRIAFHSGGYVSEMWVMENFLPTAVASDAK
jgi:Tol biopolymer transport system component